MKCCYAPEGVLFLSEGKRFKPLNPCSAKYYLESRGFFDKDDTDAIAFYELAQEVANEIYTSCCPCVLDQYISSTEDEAFDDAYKLIVDVYSEIDKNVPVAVRAAAALPSIWEIFCEMIADELDVLLDLLDTDYDDEEADEFDD